MQKGRNVYVHLKKRIKHHDKRRSHSKTSSTYFFFLLGLIRNRKIRIDLMQTESINNVFCIDYLTERPQTDARII